MRIALATDSSPAWIGLGVQIATIPGGSGSDGLANTSQGQMLAAFIALGMLIVSIALLVYRPSYEDYLKNLNQ